VDFARLDQRHPPPRPVQRHVTRRKPSSSGSAR
jgi:hypothetical protein